MLKPWGIAIVLFALAGGTALAQEAQQPSVIAPELAQPPLTEPSGTGTGNGPGNGTGPALVVQTPKPKAGQPVGAPIMTIDPDEVFSKSRWGARVQADVERRSRDIKAENDRLADQFSAEEQQLTQLRSTLSDDEFRQRADEFDKRVVEVRRQRDGIMRDLQDEIEEERAAFFRAALPVLAKLMQEHGATVVLDQRAIFVSAESADVTDALIQRFDQTVGAGPVQPIPAPKTEAAPEKPTAPEKPAP